jgi:hypothetical protein
LMEDDYDEESDEKGVACYDEGNADH